MSGAQSAAERLFGADPAAAYRTAGWPVAVPVLGRYELACGDGLVALVADGAAGARALDALEGAYGKLPPTWRTTHEGGAVRVYRHRGTLRSAPNLHGTTPGLHLRGLGAAVRVPPDAEAPRWLDRLPALALDGIPELPAWLDRMARDPAEGRKAWDAALAPKPPTFARTDYGNAERLVARHGADLRYCHAWGSWLVWDGTRWVKDDSGEVVRRAKDTVRSIVDEAQRCTHEETRRALLGHAVASEKSSRLTAMIDLARSEPGVPVAPADLDADGWLLNCANGVLDLRTATLRPPRREDLCTRRAPVAYSDAATCPAFDAFLAAVQPDARMRAFVQRLVGYFATGIIREHVFPIHYGTGGNGKGTFTELVLAVLGDYARQVPTELLLAKDRPDHPTDRTTLLGTRFAAASETDDGRKLASALVKGLTGGDTVSGRVMHGDFFEWKPTHHLWLQTNHRPVIEDTTDGIWRRVLMIGWSVSIPKAQQDTKLPEKLAAEHPGVLRWIAQGCLAWQREGLDPPPEVLAATTDYRASSDWLGEFLAACCATTPERPGGPVWAAAKEVFTAYRAWAEDAGYDAKTQTALGKALSAKGFRRVKSGTYRWEGVRLASGGTPTADPPDDGGPEF